MNIPKVFIPEKSLEKKVKELSKKGYKGHKKFYSENPSFTELNDRVEPVFEDFVKTVYGEHSSNIVKLKDVPDPYEGWIDLITKNYESEEYYCTLFDLKSERGTELRNKFLKSHKGNNMYHFKPHNRFSVKGKLVKEGVTNDFKWYILKTYVKIK